MTTPLPAPLTVELPLWLACVLWPLAGLGLIALCLLILVLLIGRDDDPHGP